MPPVVLWTQLNVGRSCRPPTAGPVAIRPGNVALAADLAAVRGIAEACHLEGAASNKRFAPAGLVAELASRPGRLVRPWLATVDAGAAPAGLVTLVVAGPPPGRCSIGWLLVHPSARRQGVATALVAQALDEARALGHDRVCVETLAAWSAAMAFWRALGFKSSH